MAVNIIATIAAAAASTATARFIITAAAMVINYSRAKAKANAAEAAQAAALSAAAARGVLLNISGNVEPIPVIYGTRKVGGLHVLVEASGTSNEYLNIVLVLCEGEISAINEIRIDDTLASDAKYSGLASIEAMLGADDQAALSSLIGEIPSKWTSAHTGSGVPYLYCKFKYDRTAFPFGLPTVTALVDGKLLYDPRSGLTVASHNPALAIRDYLTNTRYAFGVDVALVDDASFTSAADYCDQLVTIPGGTQARYTCDGIVDTDGRLYDNMPGLLSSCRGSLVFSGGKYKLVLDKPDGVVVLSGTAQAGANKSLTLAVGASEVVDAYAGVMVRVSGGAGAGQEKLAVGSRKNFIQYSQTFDNPYWLKSSIVSVIPNDDGAASKFTVGTWVSGQTGAGTATYSADGPAGTMTYSIEIKQGAGQYIGFKITDCMTFHLIVRYDLTNRVIERSTAPLFCGLNNSDHTTADSPNFVSATIIETGDGYLKCSLTFIKDTYSVYLRALQFYGADGLINTDTSGMYLWARNAQLEEGIVPTEYIHTEAYPAVGVLINDAWAEQPDATSTYELLTERERFQFTEDNITGAWEIRPPSRAEKFNRVTASFINPEKNWQPDIAVQQSIPYRIADGNRVIEAKIDLPYTTNSYTAQQIAQMELKQSRFALSVRFTALQEGLVCDVGDVVEITHSTPNWVAKPFRVQQINPLDTDEVEVICLEYDFSVYLLDPLALYSPAAAANLPDASSIAMPGNLAVLETLYQTSGSVGIRSRASVSWSAPADPYILNYELEYRKDSGSWVELVNIKGTSTEIDDLPVGMYEWRVKTMNVIGVTSNYSAIVKQPIYGLTAPPADVSNLAIVATGGQARATWTLHPDLDVRIGGRVLFRWSNLTSGANWMNAIAVGEANGDAVTVMLPLLTGTYLARAEDSTGNLSSNDATFGADEALATGWTTVLTSTQHSTFSGIKTNCSVVDNVLKLSTDMLWDDVPGEIDSWGFIDNLGGVSANGSYEFDAPMNFGTLAVRKLSVHIASSSYGIDGAFDSRVVSIDSWADIDGDKVLDCSASLYVSTSPDAINYGTWTPFMSGEFNCMAAMFRLDLASGSNDHNIAVSELSVSARIAV